MIAGIVANYSWHTAALLGATANLFLAPLSALLLRRSPEVCGLLPDGWAAIPEEEEAALKETTTTTGEVQETSEISVRRFWAHFVFTFFYALMFGGCDFYMMEMVAEAGRKTGKTGGWGGWGRLRRLVRLGWLGGRIKVHVADHSIRLGERLYSDICGRLSVNTTRFSLWPLSPFQKTLARADRHRCPPSATGLTGHTVGLIRFTCQATVGVRDVSVPLHVFAPLALSSSVSIPVVGELMDAYSRPVRRSAVRCPACGFRGDEWAEEGSIQWWTDQMEVEVKL